MADDWLVEDVPRRARCGRPRGRSPRSAAHAISSSAGYEAQTWSEPGLGLHDEGKYYVSRAFIRGSNMGVRIFAVGVLVLGLIAGITAGFLKQGGGNDSVKVAAEKAEPPRTSERISRLHPLRPTSRSKCRPVRRPRSSAPNWRRRPGPRRPRRPRLRPLARRLRRRPRPRRRSGRPAPPPAPGGRRRAGASHGGGVQELLRQPCHRLHADGGRGLRERSVRCLDPLWKKESGWNHKAQNYSSGAYGIRRRFRATRWRIRRGLGDQPGRADQVGPELHQGPLRRPLWRMAALAGQGLVLDPPRWRRLAQSQPEHPVPGSDRLPGTVVSGECPAEVVTGRNTPVTGYCPNF